MIKNFIKKIFKRKYKDMKELNSKVERIGVVDFRCIYQDNNIENIFRGIFGGDKKEINYSNQVDYIKDNIRNNDYLKSLIEGSSCIINLFLIDKKIDINKLIEVALEFKGKISVTSDDENYYWLLSGSISDYKNLIKYSNINNEIIQSVIESMYQTNSLYFEDMYDIMDKTLFVDDDNIVLKYKPISLEYGALCEITPVKHVYDAVKQYGFDIKDIFNVSSIVYMDEIASTLIKVPLFEFYRNIIKPIRDEDCHYIQEELDKTYPQLTKYIKPVYKSVDEDVESYNEIDEAVGEIKEETFDIKKELIYEDEDGELHYDEANFM